MPTPFSLLDAADFLSGVQGLLPRGRAWPRRLTATLAQFAGGIGDALYDFHQQCVQLLEVESDPARTVQLLPDWEADYGLPDSCSGPSPTLEQRHNALLAKIGAVGGQSAAYYTGFAASLGYAITITTWDAWVGWDSPWMPVTDVDWRFAWQVNAPSITVFFFDGWSSPWDPLWSISDTELECRLNKIAPAYGTLWIN